MDSQFSMLYLGFSIIFTALSLLHNLPIYGIALIRVIVFIQIEAQAFIPMNGY